LIDDDLAGFVRATLRSVWALELLLLMKRRADEAWTPERLVQELRASTSLVSEILQDLTTAGIVSRTSDGAYQYGPASEVVRNCCDALEKAHRERPLSVVKLIASAQNDRLQTFADAFRFKDK